MGILLAYNRQTTYSWEDLIEFTGMSSDTLFGQITSIVKAKVLLVTGETGKPQSQYALNFDFKSKKVKMNLNVPIKSEVKQETQEVHQNVEDDRKLLIQVINILNIGCHR
jgi:cullin 1